MKQTVIDILIYLFEHYMDEEIELESDQARLEDELRDAGFDAAQVGKAFDWLQDLASQQGEYPDIASAAATTTRVYSTEELVKLDIECRGFMYFLEHVGVLDPASRELVIDRVLALDRDDVDLEQLKWVILMVLFNQPGQEQAFLWMEDLITDDAAARVH